MSHVCTLCKHEMSDWSTNRPRLLIIITILESATSLTDPECGHQCPQWEKGPQETVVAPVIALAAHVLGGLSILHGDRDPLGDIVGEVIPCWSLIASRKRLLEVPWKISSTGCYQRVLQLNSHASSPLHSDPQGNERRNSEASCSCTSACSNMVVVFRTSSDWIHHRHRPGIM